MAFFFCSCGLSLSLSFPGSVLHILRWQRLVNRTEWLRAEKVGQLVAQYSGNEGSSSISSNAVQHNRKKPALVTGKEGGRLQSLTRA